MTLDFTRAAVSDVRPFAPILLKNGGLNGSKSTWIPFGPSSKKFLPHPENGVSGMIFFPVARSRRKAGM